MMIPYLLPPSSVRLHQWSSPRAPSSPQLRSYLFQFGPIAVALNTRILYPLSLFHRSFPLFEIRMNHPETHDPRVDLNHAVLLVGYDSHENQKDIWICKNSWGSQWGHDGYFAIQQNSRQNPLFLEGMFVIQFSPIPNPFVSTLDHEKDPPSSTPSLRSPLNQSSVQGFDKTLGTSYSSLSPLYEPLSSLPPLLKLSTKTSLPSQFYWNNHENRLGYPIVGSVLDQGSFHLSWLFASMQTISSALSLHFSNHPETFLHGSIQSFLDSLLSAPEHCLLYVQKKSYYQNIYDKDTLWKHGNFIFFESILNGSLSLTKGYQICLNSHSKEGIGIFPEYVSPFQKNTNDPYYYPKGDVYVHLTSKKSYPISSSPLSPHLFYVDRKLVHYWGIDILLLFCILGIGTMTYLLYNYNTFTSKSM